ncbi:MAG: hypothetical protein FD180_1210 [Planctomycetota bacterium]|nr:MAG: hypothetical protein FD180_1210 [Planctomycetota bacterium]
MARLDVPSADERARTQRGSFKISLDEVGPGFVVAAVTNPQAEGWECLELAVCTAATE